MDKIESLHHIYKDLNENERVAVEGILDNAVTQLKMVQSHIRRTLLGTGKVLGNLAAGLWEMLTGLSNSALASWS
ncbi:hypothetical protein MKW98_014015 [Papaver atlanticum]|uniref:Uncharacterized protein n=1 Tax=Papaver atlanticum TaxID=357466 RepID=A0AAD4SJR4_9MAGN|nr:hypothetical protein MKW98_014015 [Papaver atlanticum]